MERHTCFVALTRPVMRCGVTVHFLGLNFFGHIIALLLTKLYLYAFVSVFLFHGIGVLVLTIDPRFMDLILGKLRCCRAENRLFWGCNSYEAY